jgi:type I restriction enzyme, S subunit
MTTKPKTVPELRFPEFDEKWKESPMNELLTFKNGYNAAKEQYGTGVKFINVLDIIQNDFITHDRIIGSVEIPAKDFGKNEVKHGDILFQRSSETREEVGQTNVYLDRDKSATFGGFVIRGRPLKTFDPVFFNSMLKTAKARKDITSRSGGSTRYNIGQESLEDVLVSIAPTLPEQRKIADFLTAVDGRIGQLSQKKALLEDYKKGVMQQLFTQALRFKDDHGNDFPEWEEKNFTDVLGTTSPRGFQIQSSEILPEGRFKVVDQGKALIAGYCDDSEKVMRTCPVIVYGDHTTIIKYVDFEFVVGADGTQILVSKDQRNDLKYLYYNLAQNNVTQEGYKRHFSILKGILMQIPSPAEQTKIANFLTALDRKIEIVAQQIRHIQAFKKGLLQQMFV